MKLANTEIFVLTIEGVVIAWTVTGIAGLVTPGVWGNVFGLLFAIITFIGFWLFAAALWPILVFFVVLPVIQYLKP